MVQNSFKTVTDEGTITISTEKKSRKLQLFLHDSHNSFDCRVELSHLNDFKKFLKDMAEKNCGEMHSYEYIIKKFGRSADDWYYGNYIRCYRATNYIKALEDIGRPTDYKIGDLRRMSTKNLMDLCNQSNVRKVILQEKKGR